MGRTVPLPFADCQNSTSGKARRSKMALTRLQVNVFAETRMLP
ncbi:hypothetical protein [Dickeya sp. CFBP 2040]|nr:hypothetical protein [Dickeya sp. CFBP 2040]